MSKRVAGIDGCKGGWVAVIADAGAPQSAQVVCAASIDTLIKGNNIDFAVVDMPIGLVSGPDSRDVESAMCKFLGKKATSVFNTPCRAALDETEHCKASEVNKGILRKGLSVQTFALFPKMREVDAIVRALGQNQKVLREGHPEVSFKVMAGRPVLSRKKRFLGGVERYELLNARGFPTLDLLKAPGDLSFAFDDLLDAAALCWSAMRYLNSQHISFPTENPSRDAFGLEMQVIA